MLPAYCLHDAGCFPRPSKRSSAKIRRAFRIILVALAGWILTSPAHAQTSDKSADRLGTRSRASGQGHFRQRFDTERGRSRWWENASRRTDGEWAEVRCGNLPRALPACVRVSPSENRARLESGFSELLSHKGER